MPVSPARQAAFAILLRVEHDGAYSSELLHAMPLMRDLSSRDHGLASEIVLGCLRRQGALDAAIAACSRRKMEKLDPEVRAALRIGCYQLQYLDRVPAHAAISESVELVKQARKASAGPFVNAVLRKLAQTPRSEQAPEQAHPAWLVERWKRFYGEETTAGILKANLSPPATYLRLNAAFPVAETLAQLAQEDIETERTELVGCVKVLRGRPDTTDTYRAGRVRIQDIGSQMVVPLLNLGRSGRSGTEPEFCAGAKAGSDRDSGGRCGIQAPSPISSHRFLDLCSAPGNKTCQALEGRGTSRKAVAADRHAHRLSLMRQLATVPVDMIVLDGEQPLPFRARFDRILVDAPCSGTGTLAHNPEIKWRLRPQDIADLAQKQIRLLTLALDALAPGGMLVYSTCSLEPEENQQVVDAVLSGRTDCRPGAYLIRVPGRDAGDGFYARQILREFRDGA
jgi:16S rRNA (cytosine967-C5)-methyltransferase